MRDPDPFTPDEERLVDEPPVPDPSVPDEEPTGTEDRDAAPDTAERDYPHEVEPDRLAGTDDEPGGASGGAI